MGMVPEIRFTKGGQTGETKNLGRFTRLVFGRLESADVPLRDAMASKKHFLIETRGSAFFLVDRHSTNGTLVNGETATEQRLFHEDVVSVGATEMVFHCPDQQSPQSTVHFISTDTPGGPGGTIQKGTDEMIRDLLNQQEEAQHESLSNLFLHLLYDLGNLASQEVETEKLARSVLEKVASVLGAQRGVIVDRTLKPVTGFALVGRWSDILEGPSGRVLRESVRKRVSIRRSLPLDAEEEDPDRTRRATESRLRVLCAPLRGAGDVVGAIYLDIVETGTDTRVPGSPFSEEYLSILAMVGRQLGLSLERASLVREKFMSEERYRVLVEKADDCIFQLDPEGNFRFVNPRVGPILGLSREEILDRPLHDLVPPAMRAGVESRIRNVLTRSGVQKFETEIVHPDGNRTQVSFSLAPLEDPSGERVGILGIGRDVTQEKQIQDRMVQAERLASLGQLVSGMAHELNNPLTSIVGFAQILADDDALSERVRKRIQLMFTEGERARNIVQKLLAFAQSPDSDSGFADINTVMREVLDLLAHDLGKEDIEVMTFFEEIPRVAGDASQFHQGFLALVTNALEAVREKGGQGVLVMKTWRIEDEIHLSITDNGVGIPPEKINRVFDPFYTSKEVGKGTGLGLSICYKIVAAHGGRITVDSSPNEGTTFEVILPATQ
ncbi:MAG: ATP-binding protein [Planctomycetota bacterium]|jgi:two-component system NtrC family sensor kinase